MICIGKTKCTSEKGLFVGNVTGNYSMGERIGLHTQERTEAQDNGYNVRQNIPEGEQVAEE